MEYIFFFVLLAYFMHPFFLDIYNTYRNKYRIKKLFGSINKELFDQNAKKIYDKLHKIPIVNLMKENIASAEELLQVKVEPICFDYDTINVEEYYLKNMFPAQSQRYVDWYVIHQIMPIKVLYHINKIYDYESEINKFFKTRYFTLNQFDIANFTSCTFTKEILKKEVVLLGMWYCYINNETIMVTLIPFSSLKDGSRTRVQIPAIVDPIMHD